MRGVVTRRLKEGVSKWRVSTALVVYSIIVAILARQSLSQPYTKGTHMHLFWTYLCVAGFPAVHVASCRVVYVCECVYFSQKCFFSDFFPRHSFYFLIFVRFVFSPVFFFFSFFLSNVFCCVPFTSIYRRRRPSLSWTTTSPASCGAFARGAWCSTTSRRASCIPSATSCPRCAGCTSIEIRVLYCCSGDVAVELLWKPRLPPHKLNLAVRLQ